MTDADDLQALIGTIVEFEFGSGVLEGVVLDIEEGHTGFRFQDELKIARGSGATLRVPPSAIIS